MRKSRVIAAVSLPAGRQRLSSSCTPPAAYYERKKLLHQPSVRHIHRRTRQRKKSCVLLDARIIKCGAFIHVIVNIHSILFQYLILFSSENASVLLCKGVAKKFQFTSFFLRARLSLWHKICHRFFLFREAVQWYRIHSLSVQDLNTITDTWLIQGILFIPLVMSLLARIMNRTGAFKG